jgi:putative transposase
MHYITRMYNGPQRKPLRLSEFNYNQNGLYFVTICTENRIEHFGTIGEGRVQLNDIGNLSHNYWQEIPNHYSNVQIDEFIIMPNHIHGIINICANVGTGHCPVLNNGAEFTVHYGQLSKIINSYKNICTKQIKKIKPEIQFQWQRSFYDNIIRDYVALQNIRKYIRDNPQHYDSKSEIETGQGNALSLR